jgi:arginine:pyruvate transaminase
MALPYSQLTHRLGRDTVDVWAVHRQAVAKKAAGEDIILLSVGDPDFPTPTPIKNHVTDQLERDRTHYSPAKGEPSLRQAIADLETTSTGRSF